MQEFTFDLSSFAFVGTLISISSVCLAQDYNPVTADLANIDADAPPSVAEVTIPSGDVVMNGLFYLAQGQIPRKTVIFLHGYPGNERNLDIAQAARRAGYNALYFNYRGSWGTGGKFSWGGTVEDTQAAVRWLRSPEIGERFRVDPAGISLLGHSVGGWSAMLAAAEDPDISCVGYLAGWDVGLAGMLMAEDDEMRQDFTNYFVTTNDPNSGPIRSGGGEALAKEMMDNSEAYHLTRVASRLTDRSILMISGAKDGVAETAVHRDPLANALRESGAERVTTIEFENGDHSFSAVRIALAETILRWLRSDC